MSPPRLEIDPGKIEHNARTLVERLAARGIAVTGVTKGTLGLPEIARALMRGGATRLADSRIENIRALRRAGLSASMTLIRSPMLSQVDGVVAHADVSFNTELEVLGGLSSAAMRAGKSHTVVLMVELGDLREGILPGDLEHIVRETLRLPNIALEGIGTNLACRSGVAPGPENMAGALDPGRFDRGDLRSRARDRLRRQLRQPSLGARLDGSWEDQRPTPGGGAPAWLRPSDSPVDRRAGHRRHHAHR